MLVILPRKKEERPEPQKVFAFLCYRGVHYSKTCVVNSIATRPWTLDW